MEYISDIFVLPKKEADSIILNSILPIFRQ